MMSHWFTTSLVSAGARCPRRSLGWDVRQHTFMNTNTHRGPRPLVVNLALIILLVSFGVSLASRLARAEWNGLFLCVKYGSELIMLLLPLWFIFRGKNWARWLLVALAFSGFCFRLPQLIQQFDGHSVGWVVAYRWHSLIEAVALVALFLPSSNRWFRGNKDAIARLTRYDTSSPNRQAGQ
jgi:hypothetical protein